MFTLAKSKILPLLIVGVIVVGFHPRAWAIDRWGFWSMGTSPVLTKQAGDLAMGMLYQFDAGLFLLPSWTMLLSWRLGVAGPRNQSIGLGLRHFLAREGLWLPYVHGLLVIQSDPTRDFGVHAGLGVEWNLLPLTGLDNLRLQIQSGVHYILANSRDDYLSLDILGVHVAWNY